MKGISHKVILCWFKHDRICCQGDKDSCRWKKIRLEDEDDFVVVLMEDSDPFVLKIR